MLPKNDLETSGEPEGEPETDISLLAPDSSPLLEADPLSLEILIHDRVNEILNKKPLTLTDADIKIAIEYYRKSRERFIKDADEKLKSKTSGETKTKPKTQSKTKPSPPPTSVASALQSTKQMDLL